MGAGTLDQVVVCSGSSRVAVAPRHRRRREVPRGRLVGPSRFAVAAATCGRVRAWAVGARSGGSRYSRVSSARRAVVCCGLRRPTAFFFLWPQGSCRHLGYVVAYRSRKHTKGVVRH